MRDSQSPVTEISLPLMISRILNLIGLGGKPEEKRPELSVISRSNHNVTRALISENALKVLRRLNRFGYTAYLAGGGVRDILLGREPKDFDIVTNAKPEEIKKIFRNAILIGRRFRIAHIRFKGEIIEVSTFRALSEPTKKNGINSPETKKTKPETEEEIADSKKKPFEGRLQSDDGLILRDNVWGTPEEDAFRRDFTVNALFYCIKDFSIIDYVGGMKDVEAGRLRLIGNPERRYKEDPVRMLRAVRFAAKLGFTIDRPTLKPISELKEEILKANPSRLYEELQKLWISEEAEKGYQLMRSTGLMGVLFPELEEWLKVEEDDYPHVFTGKALEWLEEELRNGEKVSPALLFAILLTGPISSRALELQEKTGSRFPVIFPAVKEIVESVRDRISIPKKDSEAIKAILYGEQRFPQTRGKRPYTWRNNPNFKEAYRYFKMKSGIEGGNEDILNWWENFEKKAASEKTIKKPKPRRRLPSKRRSK